MTAAFHFGDVVLLCALPHCDGARKNLAELGH